MKSNSSLDAEGAERLLSGLVLYQRGITTRLFTTRVETVYSTGLISTGDRAFVNFQGTAYEVSPSSLADLNRRWSQRRSGTTTFGGLGLHPLDWVHNPSKEGDSNIAGVKTTHVSASLDVGKMLADLNHLGVVVIRDSREEARRVLEAIFASNGRATPWTNQPVGTAEDVAEFIAPYLELGYHHVIAGFPNPYDEESMTRLATDVRPLLGANA